MKAFYVDIARDLDIALVAGPFVSEEAARKYEIAAFQAAYKADRMQCVGRYGITSIPVEEAKLPGKLNDMIDIDPADMLPGFAKPPHAAVN